MQVHFEDDKECIGECQVSEFAESGVREPINRLYVSK